MPYVGSNRLDARYRPLFLGSQMVLISRRSAEQSVLVTRLHHDSADNAESAEAFCRSIVSVGLGRASHSLLLTYKELGAPLQHDVFLRLQSPCLLQWLLPFLSSALQVTLVPEL